MHDCARSRHLLHVRLHPFTLRYVRAEERLLEHRRLDSRGSAPPPPRSPTLASHEHAAQPPCLYAHGEEGPLLFPPAAQLTPWWVARRLSITAADRLRPLQVEADKKTEAGWCFNALTGVDRQCANADCESGASAQGAAGCTACCEQWRTHRVQPHQQPEVNYLPRFSPQLISVERYTQPSIDFP